MARPDAGAVIPVKVFVKEEQISPVRIILEEFRAARYGTAPVFSPDKNMNETP